MSNVNFIIFDFIQLNLDSKFAMFKNEKLPFRFQIRHNNVSIILLANFISNNMLEQCKFSCNTQRSQNNIMSHFRIFSLHINLEFAILSTLEPLLSETTLKSYVIDKHLKSGDCLIQVNLWSPFFGIHFV